MDDWEDRGTKEGGVAEIGTGSGDSTVYSS